MHTLTLTLAHTPALTLAQAGGAPAGSGWSTIIMIVLMIVIFYFFMIRPQANRQKELQKARDAMKAGDQVITTGGILGTVKNIDTAKGQMVIEIADGIKVRVSSEHVFPAEKPSEKK